MKKSLVVGGAGYIGSHMVKCLIQAARRQMPDASEQHDVIVLDDLSTGHREAITGGKFIQGNAGDTSVLDDVFRKHRIDCVVHFASFIEVGESVRDPDKYYRNNVANTLVLLDAMARHGIKKFVFSSSAAVYGNVPQKPIVEEQPCAPVNPYGDTKWIVEKALDERARANGLKSVALRYFNAAGADPDGKLGERHEPESHLIPLVLQAASGRRAKIRIFGRDYPTPDGTCIRDYIHVSDLCDAHLLAMRYLTDGGESRVFNVGNGNGFSVLEVIETARRVTGKPIPAEDSPRRPGDSPMLVADAGRIKRKLGWRPRYPKLDTIIEHAWKWELKKGKLW